MQLTWLIIDAATVFIAAWVLLQVSRKAEYGAVELFVKWGVYVFTLVAGTGVLLGAMGQLSPLGFRSAHLAIFLGVVGWRGSRIGADFRESRALLARSLAHLRGDPLARYALLMVLIFLLATAFLATAGEPGIYDSLTYRLSRVGHWLQEGRLGFMVTNDARQNYMPVVPEMVMAWLLGGTDSGYRGAALVQWGGGVLLLTATVGLARQLGLSRSAALGAALLVAGCANVAPQFSSTHTDLFTSGLVAAAFFLWRTEANRGRGSVMAGIAGGLALGAKGTVFYLLPTLALWALWYVWRQRLPISAWARTLLALGAATLAFAAPVWVQNWRHYGGPFGPAEFVKMHHQGGEGQWGLKVTLNLASSFIQVLEPHSQPPGMDHLSVAGSTWLIKELPVSDPFTFEQGDRRSMLLSLLTRRTPDADGTSFGLVLVGLVLVGGIAAFTFGRLRQGAAEIRWSLAGVGLFLVFFHAMQQWHPYGFRYFILIAPWMGVVAAWWMEGLSRGARRAAWSAALLSATLVGAHTLTQTHNAAWPMVARPDKSIYFYVFRAWRSWLQELDTEGRPLQVALPFNRELAPFYRLEGPRAVSLVETETLQGLSAEQAVARNPQAWLITTPQQFAGNEGHVLRRTWFFQGDETSVYSLVAYRAKIAGEEP